MSVASGCVCPSVVSVASVTSVVSVASVAAVYVGWN